MQTTSPKTFVRLPTPAQRRSSTQAARPRTLGRFLAVLLRSLSAWCM